MDELIKKVTDHPLVKQASGWERMIYIVIMLVFLTPGGMGLVSDALAEVTDKLAQQEKIVERLANIEAEKVATKVEFVGIKNSVQQVQADQMLIGVKMGNVEKNQVRMEKQFDEYRLEQRQFQTEMRQWMMTK